MRSSLSALAACLVLLRFPAAAPGPPDPLFPPQPAERGILRSRCVVTAEAVLCANVCVPWPDCRRMGPRRRPPGRGALPALALALALSARPAAALNPPTELSPPEPPSSSIEQPLPPPSGNGASIESVPLPQPNMPPQEQ